MSQFPGSTDLTFKTETYKCHTFAGSRKSTIKTVTQICHNILGNEKDSKNYPILGKVKLASKIALEVFKLLVFS